MKFFLKKIIIIKFMTFMIIIIKFIISNRNNYDNEIK